MVHRDIELCRLTGARVHLLHLSTARQRRAGARRPRPTACRSPPRPRRTTSRLTDELLRRLRPGVQGQPAAAHAAPTSTPIRAGLADGTIDAIATDHAPHPPRDQGAAARPGAARDARPGDGARRLALAELDMPLADIVAALSWKPAAIAGVGRPSRPADRRRGAGQPHRVRSRRRVGGGARPAGEQEPQHAVRRHARCAARSATRSSTATVVVRDGERPDDLDTHALEWMFMQHDCETCSDLPARGQISTDFGMARGSAMSRETIRDGALVLADGSVFEGELIGAEAPASPPARSCSTP